MKIKTVVLAGALLLAATLAHADPLCTNWGMGLNVCLPLSTVEAAYGYNFNATEKGSQALLETTIGKIKDKVAFTFGGAKSPGEGASPYLSVTYGVTNPITQEGNPLSWIRPGIYGGKHFDTREYIYGLKASVNIW